MNLLDVQRVSGLKFSQFTDIILRVQATITSPYKFDPITSEDSTLLKKIIDAADGHTLAQDTQIIISKVREAYEKATA